MVFEERRPGYEVSTCGAYIVTSIRRGPDCFRFGAWRAGARYNINLGWYNETHDARDRCQIIESSNPGERPANPEPWLRIVLAPETAAPPAPPAPDPPRTRKVRAKRVPKKRRKRRGRGTSKAHQALTTGQKICCTCHDTKDLDDFHRYSRSPDGRQPRCKDCMRINDLAKYLERQRAREAEVGRA